MSSFTPRHAVDRVAARVQDHLAHIAMRARHSPAGIGVAVLHTGVKQGTREWICIAGDGREWHYLRVLGSDIGPFVNLPPEVVEDGIERFAATLPAAHRLGHLLNANPLHIDHIGNVTD